jgi:hypothetical protein
MKKYSILWFAVLLCGLSTSCKDFLNEYSQNLAYIETASDLEELLLGSGYQDRHDDLSGSGNSYIWK